MTNEELKKIWSEKFAVGAEESCRCLCVNLSNT